jgi:uncharacterized protein
MILDQIKADQLAARKNKDAMAAGLLTTLLSEVSIVGKNNNRDTTDEEAIAVIKKFIKNNNEFVNTVKDNTNDKDEATYLNLLKEAEILNSYLPKQLSEVELICIVERSIDSGKTETNMGSIMNYMKANYNGMYDGKVLSSIAKRIIQ